MTYLVRVSKSKARTSAFLRRLISKVSRPPIFKLCVYSNRGVKNSLKGVTYEFKVDNALIAAKLEHFLLSTQDCVCLCSWTPG